MPLPISPPVFSDKRITAHRWMLSGFHAMLSGSARSQHQPVVCWLFILHRYQSFPVFLRHNDDLRGGYGTVYACCFAKIQYFSAYSKISDVFLTHIV